MTILSLLSLFFKNEVIFIAFFFKKIYNKLCSEKFSIKN